MNSSPSHFANNHSSSTDAYHCESDDEEIFATSEHLLKSYDSSSDDITSSDSLSPPLSPPTFTHFRTFPQIREKNRPVNRFTKVHCLLIGKLYLIMTMLLFGIILLLNFAIKDSLSELAANNVTANEGEEKRVPFQINLDRANQYRLFWTVDEADESLLFELRIRQSAGAFNWFAFGFSDYGDIAGADACLLWFDKRGKLRFDDINTDNESFVLQDQQSNDCRFIKAKRTGNILRVAFSRSWDTCDPEDYLIDSGTTHLIYATGPGPIARIEGLRLQAHPHGFQRAQLLKPPSASKPSKLSYYVKKFEALHDNLTVPAVETTYWCRLLKLPPDFLTRSHILQYESVISNDSHALVHHMELFHCEVNSTLELPPWNGLCADPKLPEPLKACKRVIAAWAYGAGPMTYPANVGFPIGGPGYSLYVMLEVHYNNPDLISGAVDSSGVRLYYTDHLRQVDAGILEIGLEYTDKNSIPPQTVMDLRGYCVAECTRASLPSYGITVFASQLHTHLTGIRAWTEHIRGGIELPNLNRDNHYSPHFQEIRRLPRPVTVFPGDALINVCRYDTRTRSRMTLGGYGIRDEMCVNYLHYYPKINLEVCKSSIDTEYLKAYFERLSKVEGQNTSASGPVSENYRNIRWNAKRSAELDRLYQIAPLSMQCNASDGSRFPGYWNGMPLTRITRPLKPKQRKCRWTLRKEKQNLELSASLAEGNSLEFAGHLDDDDLGPVDDEDSQLEDLIIPRKRRISKRSEEESPKERVGEEEEMRRVLETLSDV